jgi:hypothetical protein
MYLLSVIYLVSEIDLKLYLVCENTSMKGKFVLQAIFMVTGCTGPFFVIRLGWGVST